MLTILGKAASINVRKVLWTCDELGLPFTREDWGAGFQSTSNPAFLARNPNAMVPPLAQQAAAVGQWMDWQATEFNNAWRYAFMALVRRSPAHQDRAQIDASVANWNRHVGILEQHLAQGSAYVAGDRFTLADIVIGLSLGRWKLAPIVRPDYPAVDAYCARLAERGGFQTYAGSAFP
ncbi:MAG TPA: glutathione S-transferase C-terminal domain-containing protein [Telluria sp.]|jgi:glutathione S-transferase